MCVFFYVKPYFFFLVAEYGHVQCVEIILQHTHGDVINFADQSGATALQLAQFAHHDSVCDLLSLQQPDQVRDRLLNTMLTCTRPK